jgi:hypothetical protein
MSVHSSFPREPRDSQVRCSWENVVEADPSWVELVTTGGNLVYGRADRLPGLGSGAGGGRFEPVPAATGAQPGRSAGPS